MAENMVYESIVNSKIIIIIQNTWGIAHKKLKKKPPPTFLGRWGRFKKEIIKLITMERNKQYNYCNCSSIMFGLEHFFSMNQHLIQVDFLT
jgi:hypothetical protein